MKIPRKPHTIIRDVWDFFLFAALVAALELAFFLLFIFITVKVATNG